MKIKVASHVVPVSRLRVISSFAHRNLYFVCIFASSCAVMYLSFPNDGMTIARPDHGVKIVIIIGICSHTQGKSKINSTEEMGGRKKRGGGLVDREVGEEQGRGT